MNRFFVAVASIFIVSGWMLTNNQFQECVFIPLLLGSIYSFISKRMDDVNTWILRDCYKIGGEIEKEIANKESIFGLIDSGHYSKGNYAKILSILYIASGIIMIVLSIISIFIYTIN